MKPIKLTWVLAAAALAQMSPAQAGSWSKASIPDSTSMWSVTWAPSGVYVGGSATDQSPAIWQKKSKWSRVAIPGSTLGQVRQLSTDPNGLVNATLGGTSYAWRSEFMRYDPEVGSWVDRGFANQAVWNEMITTGSTSVLAGGVNDLLVKKGVIDVYIGDSNLGSSFLTDAQFFSTTAVDDLSGVFVAGRFNDWDINIENQWGKPGLWYVSQRSVENIGFREFWNIPLPETVQQVDAMTSDRQGNLFVGETDATQASQVLALSDINGEFASTGLQANNITAMTTSSKGTVYVAGQDTKNRGQIWRYKMAKGKSPARWVSLSIGNAMLISDITTSPQGALYAVGYNQRHEPTLWSYK